MYIPTPDKSFFNTNLPIPPSPPCIWITHHMTYLRVLGLKITAGSKKASLRVLT